MIFIVVFGAICFLILFVQVFAAALRDRSSKTPKGEKIFYLILIAVCIAILSAIVM